MRAGRLRHLVTFQAWTSAGDGQGGRTPAWATVGAADDPCELETLGSREGLDASQVTASVRYRVKVRGRTDLLPKHRAVVTQVDTGTTLTLEIEAIERGDDRGRETHAVCVVDQR